MSRLKTTEHGGGRPESPCFSRQPATGPERARRQEAGGTMPDARAGPRVRESGICICTFSIAIALPFPSFLRCGTCVLPPLLLYVRTHTPRTRGRGPLGCPLLAPKT